MLTLFRLIRRAKLKNTADHEPSHAMRAEFFYDVSDPDALKSAERLVRSREFRWRLLY